MEQGEAALLSGSKTNQHRFEMRRGRSTCGERMLVPDVLFVDSPARC